MSLQIGIATKANQSLHSLTVVSISLSHVSLTVPEIISAALQLNSWALIGWFIYFYLQFNTVSLFDLFSAVPSIYESKSATTEDTNADVH